MERKQALIELRDKVKAGDDSGFRPANRAVFTTPCQDMALQLREEHSRHAYKGSLDAANALHDAVLPGWFWSIDTEDCGVCVYTHLLDDAQVGKSDTPARAWLLAILEALIAQENDE